MHQLYVKKHELNPIENKRKQLDSLCFDVSIASPTYNGMNTRIYGALSQTFFEQKQNFKIIPSILNYGFI